MVAKKQKKLKQATKAIPAKKASKAIESTTAIEVETATEALDAKTAVDVNTATKIETAPEVVTAPELIKRKPGRPRKWTDEAMEALAIELEAWFHADEGNLFWTEFFALKKINRSSISRWQSVNETFANTLKRIEKLSEARLVRKGMKAGHNPGMAIFVLKNKHGYVDKRELSTTNDTVIRVEDLTKMKALPDEQLTDSLRWLTEPRRNG